VVAPKTIVVWPACVQALASWWFVPAWRCGRLLAAYSAAGQFTPMRPTNYAHLLHPNLLAVVDAHRSSSSQADRSH